MQRFLEFEFVRSNLPESKLSTIDSNEKKANLKVQIREHNMGLYDNVVQEIDFLSTAVAKGHSESIVAHDFLVFSIVGCANCDLFMDKAALMKEDIHELVMNVTSSEDNCIPENANIRVRKVDVTSEVRNSVANKEAFRNYITERFQYKAYQSSLKPQEQRMYFPIIIYNGVYLGGVDASLKKLKKCVGHLMDQLEKVM